MVAGGLGGRPPSMHRRGDGTLSDASFGPASGRVVAVVECDHGPARARGPHLPCSCIAESCVRAATVLQDVGCRERSLWTRSRCLSVWRLAVEAESLSSAERVGDGGGGGWLSRHTMEHASRSRRALDPVNRGGAAFQSRRDRRALPWGAGAVSSSGNGGVCWWVRGARGCPLGSSPPH